MIEVFESSLLEEQKALSVEHDCLTCAAYAQGAKDALEWVRTGKGPPSLGILKDVHDLQVH